MGAVVRRCLEQGCLLRDLSLEAWQDLHPAFEADLFAALEPKAVVAARRSEGGTGFDRVDEQLEIWSQRLHESHTAG